PTSGGCPHSGNSGTRSATAMPAMRFDRLLPLTLPWGATGPTNPCSLLGHRRLIGQFAVCSEDRFQIPSSGLVAVESLLISRAAPAAPPDWAENRTGASNKA